MKAELRQLFQPKARNVINAFKADGIDMDSDEHLFICYDERYAPEHQSPVLCTGQVAKDRLADGHYRIEYGGLNSDTKMSRRARRHKEAIERSRQSVEKALEEMKKIKAGDHLTETKEDVTIKPGRPPKQKQPLIIE